MTPEEQSALLEILAAEEHERWSKWMRYQFSQGTENADGSWTMYPSKVARWRRQMDTPYERLSDAEQESDRNQVRLMVAALDKAGYEIRKKEAVDDTEPLPG